MRPSFREASVKLRLAGSRVALVALVALGACESQRPALVPEPAPDPAPSGDTPRPAESKPAETQPAETQPAESKPGDPEPAEPVAEVKPAPESRAPASIHRSSEVSAALVECKMPQPPGACSSDADCSSFEIGVGQCGGCGSTLSVGVTAAQKNAYLAKAKCQHPACNKVSHPCVAYWYIADDGSRGGPLDIDVRCAKSGAGAGRCLTLRTHH